MKRFIFGLSVVLGSVVGFTGCELTKQGQRVSSSEGNPIPSDEPEVDEDLVKYAPIDAAPVKNFFHGSRLPGAWSSDARDIERNLGVQ